MSYPESPLSSLARTRSAADAAGARFWTEMSADRRGPTGAMLMDILGTEPPSRDPSLLPPLGSPVHLEDAWQPRGLQRRSPPSPLPVAPPLAEAQPPNAAVRSPRTPPRSLALSSSGSPRSPRSCAVEQALQAGHLRDQAAIARAFHASPPDPAHSYVVNTVSVEEGVFLAAYLGVPEENVLKVKCHGLREGNRVHGDLRRTLEDFFADKTEILAAITFLGHMELDDQNDPRFAKMSPRVLFDLLADLRPRSLNFFSCSSVDYATRIGEQFSQSGAPLAKMTCFADAMEVSQWPRRTNRSKPLRMFYAGPELGADTPRFSPTLHSPVLPWVRELQIP